MNKKRIAKLILILISALSLCISLCGCSYSVSDSDAKARLEAFFVKVSEDDIYGATMLMHPDVSVTVSDMSKYIASLEEYDGIDFSKGVTITGYTGSTYAEHDSDINGALYRLNFELKIGDADAKGQAEFADNRNGFGIYNIIIIPNGREK